MARRTERVIDEKHLHASIVEREALCSRALGGGVAVVHPRRRVPLAVHDRTHVHALARLVRVLRSDTLDALRTAPDAASVIAILRSREQDVDAAAPPASEPWLDTYTGGSPSNAADWRGWRCALR